MKKKKLNKKQTCFCYEYVKDYNATKAAQRAGYSLKTAYSIGQRLLKKVEIQDLIKDLEKKVQERNNIEVDEVVQFLANSLRLDVAEYHEKDGTLKKLDEMSDRARKLIDSIEYDSLGQITKIKFIGKNQSAEKLMKYFGAYLKDNQQKTPKIVQTTVYQLPDNGR